MTKNFDDIVNNFKEPSPEWQVEIDGKDFSNNLELIEFTSEINNPLKFTVKLSGVSSNVNIPKDAKTVVRRNGSKVFTGVLQQVEPNMFNTYTFQGTGYTAELQGDIDRQYSGTTVSNIVDDIISTEVERIDDFESGSSELGWENEPAFSVTGNSDVYGTYNLTITDGVATKSLETTATSRCKASVKVNGLAVLSTADTFTLDFRHDNEDVITVWFLGDGFQTGADSIVVSTPFEDDTYKVLQPWSADTVYDIEVIPDFSNSTYDIIVNGEKTEGIGFKDTTADELESVRLSLDTSNNAEVFVDNLTYRGFDTISEIETSFDLQNNLSVEDFRAKNKQLKDINRLIGEYGVEWYETYDAERQMPVFNLTDEMRFTKDNGDPLDTLKLYGADQSAKKVDQNINRNKGDFTGVIVKGYGDGEDQIVATAGTTGKGQKALIYTDKTILSESQAQKRADELNASKTVDWQEIEVKPSNPNKIYSIGDELKIEAEEARLNDTYRVVQSYYKYWPEQDQFESKLNLSNKPQTFVEEFKRTEETTESQTEYNQGSKNRYADKESEIADSNNPINLEVYVPEDVKDSAGANNFKEATLQYSLKDYKDYASSSDLETGEAKSSTGIKGSLDNETVAMATANNTATLPKDASAVGQIQFDVDVPDDPASNTVLGIDSGWSFTNESGNDIYLRLEIYVNDVDRSGNPDYKKEGIFVADDSSKNQNINIDGAGEGDTVTFYFRSENSFGTGEYWFETKAGAAFFTDLEVYLTTYGEHAHSDGYGTSDGFHGGGSGDYQHGVNGGMTTSLSSSSKQASEVKIETKAANETSFTDRTNDIYGQATSGKEKDEEIDISSYVSTPGWNEIRIYPQGTAYCIGNANVDYYKED